MEGMMSNEKTQKDFSGQDVPTKVDVYEIALEAELGRWTSLHEFLWG
jgi:hypothetical protein